MPKLMPAPMMPATSGREAFCQHSETNTTPFGHMPPTPSPTRKRNTSICSCVLTSVPKPVNTEYQTMLIPIARVRPMRSPRLPSAIPPTAAPSIRLAVNRPNQSPASVLLNSEPNKLRDTDSEATGISPSWTPAKTRPAKAANRTARRA